MRGQLDARADVIEGLVESLLLALGEDVGRDGLVDTPRRVAAAWLDLTSGYDADPSDHLSRRFPADLDHGQTDHGLIVVRDIPFYSLCEHHMIPFHGKAHVGYIPTDHVVGLSKIARCVRGFAARLQVQERLTAQVADAMVDRLHPEGVIVVVEAEHLCMGMRGVKADGSVTVTSAVRGALLDNDSTRAEALRLLGQ